MIEQLPHLIDFASCRRENRDLLASISAETARVIASGQMLQGTETQAFEDALAASCQRRHAVCVGSGTDALFFALCSQGVGSGDEVLVPDISFVTSASAVLRTGAVPVFVDINASCNLDLDRASACITSKTKAIVYVQLFGGMGDPERLERFADNHSLRIIEDGAQSFGARYAERSCGSVGHASALSFDPMKVLSALGSGGAVLTDDDEVAHRIRRLRYHGRQDGTYLDLGFNSQLSEVSAAALLVKLKHQPFWARRRKAIADYYLRELAGLPISFPVWSDKVDHVWHKFVLHCEAREPLAAFLKSSGIPTMIHYSRPFHREPIFARQTSAQFPAASRHADTALSLPIHAYLTKTETQTIVEAITSFFNRSHA